MAVAGVEADGDAAGTGGGVEGKDGLEAVLLQDVTHIHLGLCPPAQPRPEHGPRPRRNSCTSTSGMAAAFDPGFPFWAGDSDSWMASSLASAAVAGAAALSASGSTGFFDRVQGKGKEVEALGTARERSGGCIPPAWLASEGREERFPRARLGGATCTRVAWLRPRCRQPNKAKHAYTYASQLNTANQTHP